MEHTIQGHETAFSPDCQHWLQAVLVHQPQPLHTANAVAATQGWALAQDHQAARAGVVRDVVWRVTC